MQLRMDGTWHAWFHLAFLRTVATSQLLTRLNQLIVMYSRKRCETQKRNESPLSSPE